MILSSAGAPVFACGTIPVPTALPTSSVMALLAYGLLRSRSRDRLRRLIRDAPTSVLASPSAAIQPSVRRPDGLVHFHPAREPITTGSDHRAPQFMQPRPGRPITAQSKDPLQIQRAGAVLLAGHIPHRPKPDRQRLPRVLDRKSTRLNSSHANISYAVFCLK